MKVELGGRAGEIFLEALERVGTARDAYLEEACGDDSRLRAQVDYLLAHHHESDLLPEPQPNRRADAVPERLVDGELTETGAFAARLLGGPRSRVLALLAVVVFVAGTGFWARYEILSKMDLQLRTSLVQRLDLERAHIREWIHGQLLAVESASQDPQLIQLAEQLSKLGTDLNEGLGARRSALTQGDLQARVKAALTHLMRRDDLEGYALIHRSGVLLASMNSEFVGEQLELLHPAATQPRFSLPTNPERWGGEVVRLKQELADLGAMAWVEAPLLRATAKSDGSTPVLVRLVVGTRASEFSRVMRTGDGDGESGSRETYAVDAGGFLRSENRFGRDYVEQLRSRGIEPVWLDGIRVEDRSGYRIPCFALIDPGDRIDRLPRDGALQGNRRTKILEELTGRLRLDDAKLDHEGICLEPYRDYRGVEVIGAWAWLAEFQFALVTEVDADEAFAAQRYVNLIVLMLLLLLGAISLFGLSSSFAVVRLFRRVKDGSKLGPYTLVKRIGEGGLGEVYLAKHALLRRPTAIKLLKRESVDPESLARFEREVQLASQLTCPNTIAVYDFGRTLEGTFYCAMEYLDGMNLAEVVRAGGDLDPARVVHILRGACASLGEAHDRGLVHRDVKPMNLMLCTHGGLHDVVKLLDFGLVKEIGSSHDRELTRPTRISGTLLYLAPERLRAPNEVDARTDLYSLGAVAYYLLTGKHHLSGGTDVDLLDRILRQEPVPLAEATDQPIPPELERLVLSCLAKSMDDRPANTAAVVAALDAIHGLAPWTEEQAARWWRAHRG